MRITKTAALLLSVASLAAFGATRSPAFAGPELRPEPLQTAVALPRPLKRKLTAEQRPAAPRDITDKSQAEPLLPYTPAWWARENAIDERLKRSITICRGC